MRSTLRTAMVFTVVGGVVAIGLGYPLVAAGLLVGFGLAFLNHRIFQASALRYIDTEGTVERKPFAGSVALRLGGCTAVALLLMVFVRQMGWGVIAALAMFQLVMIGSSMVGLLRSQRAQINQIAPGSDEDA